MIGQGNVAIGNFIPTTRASTDHDHDDHIHPTDLSPRSSSGSGSSLTSDSHSHSSPSPSSIKDELSPLQRLQFAVDKNTLFSNLFNGGEVRDGYGHSMFLPPSNNNNSVQRDSSPTPSSGLSPNLIIPTSKSSQENNIMGTVVSPIGSPNSDPANIFQCPLCSIVCNGRHSFNEHLVTHSQHHACPDPKCDYLTSSEDKLRDHVQEVHDLADPNEALDEDDTAQPKVNSQGKVKMFKCKQCEHVSVTKKEFWSHSKSHIRTEKMLKCPKCDFVTEYKHHLEYHVRNHVGSKPFQCNSCTYTCVNKSMLNSHLKSHSAVYQYRCADCSYATKYCHSLKLHLRKYSHNPSMVLNPDGTPNPLPIIDVYGTRRGPKMKKTTTANAPLPLTPLPPMKRQRKKDATMVKEDKSQSVPMKRNYTIKQEPQISPAMKGGYDHFLPPASSPSNLPMLNRFTSESSDSDNEGRRIYSNKRQGREIPMSPKTPNTGLNPAFHRHSPVPDAHNVLEQLANKNQLELYAAALKQYLFSNPLLHLAGQTNPELAAQLAKEHQEKFLSQFLINKGMLSPMMPVVGQNVDNSHASSIPLDLRHQKCESLSPSHNSQPEKKRNRKGKALRYERSTMNPIRHHHEEDEDENEALDFSNNNNISNKVNSDRNYTVIHGQEQQTSQNANTMMCKYCEISFPDPVLYRMHMSYHSGDMDPFLCKSCGKKTKDKVAFFLHLTTDSH